jgi:heme-degrading monooxygenase HmoA
MNKVERNMVVEQAILVIEEAQRSNFEADFKVAIQYVKQTSGFLDYSLSRGVERPNHYLLLVNWENLTDHTVGFAESGLRAQWRSHIQHYFQPGTSVQHFNPVEPA